MLVDIKSATITGKGQIAIPKAIRQISGFKEGNKIAIMAFSDRIEIRPISNFEKRMQTAFASEKVLAKDWNTKEEDQAWKKL